MKRHIISLLFLLCLMTAASSAELIFSTLQYQAISETPAKTTGLDMIYVLYQTQGATAKFRCSGNASAAKCQTFNYMGAAYGTDVAETDLTRSGNDLTLSNIKSNSGYAIEDNGKTYYFWIADYSSAPCTVSGFNFNTDQDCGSAALVPEGTAPKITYYSITGRGYDLPRGLDITYNTLEFNTEEHRYIQIEKTASFNSFGSIIFIDAPLCDTYFHFNGDKYERAWELASEIISPSYTAIAVDAETTAEQTARDNENELKVDGSLGGSAPSEITFTAEVTDAAIYNEWQFSKDSQFEQIDLRVNQTSYTHTFRDMGTFYVRFVAANADATCDYTSEVYTVFIGESRLKCPNAFSPGASPGVNDEWKVSYKSIVSFECHIFNKWGEQITEFKDPSKGWDGKYKGKLVPAGVYYYVIKAKGADGKKYNLSGDINIVGYK